METLVSMDMTLIVFATNHLDVKVTYLYGREYSDEDASTLAYESLVHDHGEEALEGFEVLSIVR